MIVLAVEARSLVPPAIVKVPVPTGPDTKAAGSAVAASRVVTLVLAPMMRPPELTVTPPVKVFCALNCSRPLPVLVNPSEPVPVTTAVTFSCAR